MFTGQTVTDFDVHSLRLQEQRDYAARRNLLASIAAPTAAQPRESLATRLMHAFTRPIRSFSLQHGS
jgi:hypothetical protein